MKYTPFSLDVNLRPEGVLIDVGSLLGALAELHDRRDARGLRYALVTMLLFISCVWGTARSRTKPLTV